MNIWLSFARGGALAWVAAGPIAAGIAATAGLWWAVVMCVIGIALGIWILIATRDAVAREGE